MTVIELFDRSPLQNLSGALPYEADHVILIGTNQKHMEACAPTYRQILERFHPTVRLELVFLPKYGIVEAVDTFVRIAKAESPVVFDISGGNDYLLSAAGIAYERLHTEGIEVYLSHISVRSGKTAGLQKPLPPHRDIRKMSLSCDEVIALHGGAIIYANQKKNGTVAWDFSEHDFGADVLQLWQVCRTDCRAWNRMCALLGELEAVCDERQSTMQRVPQTVTLSYDTLRQKGKTQTAASVLPFLEQFSAMGVLKSLQNTPDTLSYTYKSAQIRAVLLKAGTVLELVTYLAAKNARTKKGVFLYGDARTGVVLDWDGDIHATAPSFPNTENEIDVLLVRGMIPVFVSCKNGNVDENELYKLSSVAAHFGAGYAKKVLVATDLQKNYASLARFRDRARQMDIVILDGVHKMTEHEFMRRIATLTSPDR